MRHIESPTGEPIAVPAVAAIPAVPCPDCAGKGHHSGTVCDVCAGYGLRGGGEPACIEPDDDHDGDTILDDEWDELGGEGGGA